MLDPDEATRIGLDGVRGHPWLRQRLPRRLEKALAALEARQARLDAARAARLAAAAAAAGGSGDDGGCDDDGGAGLAAALEELLQAADSPEAVRRLRERAESPYVDLSPEHVGSPAEVRVDSTRPLASRLARIGSRALSLARSGTARGRALEEAIAAALEGGGGAGGGGVRGPGGGSPGWRSSDSAASTTRGASHGSNGGDGGLGALPPLALGAPAQGPPRRGGGGGWRAPARQLLDTAHGRQARGGK
jgi:hypothetical protein